jgi:hypothetical protein
MQTKFFLIIYILVNIKRLRHTLKMKNVFLGKSRINSTPVLKYITNYIK